MEEQQSITAGNQSSQALTPPDGQSMENMQQVNPGANPAVAIPQGSRSMVLGNNTPRRRNTSCMVGLRKLRILLWKNFLLRRRAWILLGLQICMLLTVMALALTIGPPSGGGRLRGPVVPRNTSMGKMVLEFGNSFNGSKILYVADNQALPRVQRITDIINENGIYQQNTPSFARLPPIWEPMEKDEVEARFNRDYATGEKNFDAAVIFEKVGQDGVNYEIRMKGDSSETGTLFSSKDTLGKGPPNRCYNVSDPNCEVEIYKKEYQDAGFLGLQILIENAILIEFFGDGLRSETKLASFPYPTFQKTHSNEHLRFFCGLFILVFIMANAFLAKSLGSERETGVKELMKLCGYPGWMQYFAWYLLAFLLDLILLVFFLSMLKFVPSGADHPRAGYHARPFFQHSDLILLLFTMLLVMISNNAFVFFLCALIKSTSIATVAAVLLPIVFIVVTMFPLIPERVGALLGISIFPQACFVAAFKIIIPFEADGGGATWSRLFESNRNIPSVNLGLLILMFLFDIVLYQSLAVYLEAILPSDYGLQKPPYYPFLAMINAVKRRRKRVKQSPDLDTVGPVPTESKARGFEPPPDHDRLVGVEVHSLVKKFGSNKTAVNGVTVKMYDGEIFALLGHNGAGKTTLISMLTGLFAPTSGTATICGYDIKTDMDKARESLGLCPQHDMLFGNLTVMEHLQIFGQMRGQRSSQVKQEAIGLLNTMHLTEKRNTVSRKLSGGQKRKLCLGMALIGGAKVVMLDEPTSGMDPEARRAIWDILLQVRGNRTILLTTHFMEEADALGERIGIMAAGELQCCGTPAFLKSFYGTGYTLKMALLPGADKAAILALVQKHISNATLKPINMPNEAFFSLPTDVTGSSALSSLFSALTAKKEEMRIEALGLSVASMDEIFVKVGEISEKVAAKAKAHPALPQKSKSSVRTKESNKDKTVQDPSIEPLESATVSEVPTASLVEDGGVQSNETAVGRTAAQKRGTILAQALALIIKRLICTKRKIFFLLFQICIPPALMLGSVLIVNSSIDPGSIPPPLVMSFEDYGNARTLYNSADQNQNRLNAMRDTIKALGSEPKQVRDVKTALEEAAKDDIIFFREKMIVAGEIVSDLEYIAWYNTIPLHAAPLSINLASNIRARELGLNTPFTIQIINHPLRTLGALKMEKSFELAGTMCKGEYGLGFSLLMVFALLLFALFFVVLPVEERLNKSRQLQMMTGIHPLTYWAIYFLWDFLILFTVTTIMILVALIVQDYKFFSSYGGLGALFLLILSFGFAIIPLAYLVSSIPKTVVGGVLILLLFLLIPLFLALIFGFIPSTASFGWFMNNMASLAGARLALKHLAQTLCLNAKCNLLEEHELNKVICPAPPGTQADKLRSCCGGSFKPEPFFKWVYETLLYDTGIVEVPGIGQILLGMFVTSLICLAIHIALELGLLRLVRSLFNRGIKTSDFIEPVNDEDIRVEGQRVSEMITTRNTANDALVVDALCKSYGNFSAVSRLTFGVHQGECFGLLGTNGAGKTTTFRMLTGDEVPSIGDVHEGRFTLKRNRRAFISQIGYCPQFDAFVPYFTGKENLQLFGRLRGVPWRNVNNEASKLLESVGLTESGNVLCKKYSGGMKRRLSAAVALIGNPPLILLDEPTSGVDPVSRRQFWEVLESVKGSGQSIILTSHSMDECEALCARLGIMVNGQLQCIGGVQHLKHRFAQGYSLTLRLKAVTDPQQQQNALGMLDGLNNEISQKFHPCMLKDQHETLLQYQIENTNIEWNVIYNNLEELKKSYGDIVEDYSVSETSLEEVFLAFSRKQYPLRNTKMSLCKRFWTCQY